MSEEEKKKNMDEIRNEVLKLREDLNRINTEKEKHFVEKEKLNKQIATLIKQVKEKKGKRDEINESVKLTKDKRDELVQSLKDKIEIIKKIKRPETPTRTEKFEKYGERGERGERGKRKSTNPAEIKKEIEMMEHKIETDAMSFDKETKMMKLIKEKKKELAEIEKAHSNQGEYFKLDGEIKELKRILNFETKGQKNRAKESQGNHEEMITISKEIDELKKKEKEEFEKFVEFKKQFKEINDSLKEKLTVLGENTERANVEIREKKEKKKKEFKEKESVDLSKLKAEVNAKMKRGEKLTTADLIVFQGDDE